MPEAEQHGGHVHHGVLRVHDAVVGRVGLGGDLLSWRGGLSLASVHMLDVMRRLGLGWGVGGEFRTNKTRTNLEVVSEGLVPHAGLPKGVDARGVDGVVAVQVRGRQHGQRPAQRVACGS